MEKLIPGQFPIGEWMWQGEWTTEKKLSWIQALEELPGQLRIILTGVSEACLETPYRDGGWTLRQVVHHMADSHMNSYIRFKLALTEDCPTIKPYAEERWAELPDTKEWPVESSVSFLELLHARWGFLLRSMSEEQFSREFYHPSSRVHMSLQQALSFYAWHTRHHIAHVELAMANHISSLQE